MVSMAHRKKITKADLILVGRKSFFSGQYFEAINSVFVLIFASQLTVAQEHIRFHFKRKNGVRSALSEKQYLS